MVFAIANTVQLIGVLKSVIPKSVSHQSLSTEYFSSSGIVSSIRSLILALYLQKRYLQCRGTGPPASLKWFPKFPPLPAKLLAPSNCCRI